MALSFTHYPFQNGQGWSNSMLSRRNVRAIRSEEGGGLVAEDVRKDRKERSPIELVAAIG